MKKYDNFSKALKNLKECLKVEEPYSVVEQTGIVGLFQICFEQSWKLMKEVLENHGRFAVRTGSPREIVKIAYQCDMIKNQEAWLEILESRNILAHTYSDEQSLNVIKSIKSDYISVFEELKNELDKRWLDI